MKLHTNLTYGQVYGALRAAKDAGLITEDVDFVVDQPGRSMSHPHGFELQLGTYDRDSLPAGTVDQHGKRMHVRRFKNSGGRGSSGVYAATWFEWGWFIKAIFEADPGARFGGDPAKSAHPEYVWGYQSMDDFHAKTDGAFK